MVSAQTMLIRIQRMKEIVGSTKLRDRLVNLEFEMEWGVKYAGCGKDAGSKNASKLLNVAAVLRDRSGQKRTQTDDEATKRVRYQRF